MEKEVMKKSEQVNGKENIISINIDNISDNKSQKINLQNVAKDIISNVAESEIPIDLDQLVIDENGYVQTVKRELRVSVDHKTGDTIVSVIDGQSRNVVRQIPKNEILAVERLITAPAGMLFRAHA